MQTYCTKKNSRKSNKRKFRRGTKKYQEHLHKMRANAAKIKARNARHQRKHPQQKSRYGFFLLIAQYMRHLQVREKLEQYVKKRKPANSVFSAADMLIGLTSLIILGLPRFYHAKKYRQEQLLAKAISIKRMFSGTTAYRFFNDFGTLTLCRELQKVNALIKREDWENAAQIIVDGDPTTIRSYENQKEGSCKGFNKLRPGQNCLQGLAYFANGDYVTAEVVGGNEVPLESLTLVTHLKNVRRLCGRIDWIRLDAGHSSALNLQNLDNFSNHGNSQKKVNYIVCVSGNCIGFTNAMETIGCRMWHRVKNGVYVQDVGKIQIFQEYTNRHRMILVKRYSTMTQKWAYYPLVTSDNKQDCITLYRFYHKRQTIESFFDEAKHSYNLEHLPCEKLYSKSVYFNLIGMAFNIMALFRRACLRRQDHHIELMTLQWRYLSMAIWWDGTTLTIERSDPDYLILIQILRRLKKYNIALEYTFDG